MEFSVDIVEKHVRIKNMSYSAERKNMKQELNMQEVCEGEIQILRLLLLVEA